MNNTLINIMIFLAIIGCHPKKQSGYQEIPVKAVDLEESAIVNDTSEIAIDPERSMIEWKGTKLMGTGKHEGTVKFKEGTLVFDNQQLISGYFIVNMKSIYITDIPLDDPVPRRNLTTHLNSDFNTIKFPEACFFIRKVKYLSNSSLKVTGDLSIKDVSNSITVDAEFDQQRNKFYTEFSFDRFDWKIGENGSWLEKKLVDPEVYLKVTVITK